MLRPSPTRHMLRLFTLGELRLETDDGRVVSRRRKPLILLAYLLRSGARPVSRTELTTLLWGHRVEAKARQSLRQALLDIATFEREIEQGHDREAVARWTGAFLDGAEDAGELTLDLWLRTERAGLNSRLSFAFERLLSSAEQRGAWRDAITIARQWTDASPLDERACTHLILALRREGHAVDALACHASFLARMKEEGGAEPSRTFVAMAHSPDEYVLAPEHRSTIA